MARPKSSGSSAGEAGSVALLFCGFLVVSLFVYGRVLQGPFVSDDLHYVRDNVYIHELSLENVVDILDPTGGAAVAVVNYTPIHLLLHAVMWKLFGTSTLGHHVANVVLHALASALLFPLLVRSRIPRMAAFFGASWFLLHPANVEAVAWISQLKSSSALVLSLASLLWFARRPALATLLFGLALFAKPTAAFVLPVAAVFAWCAADPARGARALLPPRRWLLVAVLVLATYAAIEFSAHQRSGAADAVLYDTPFVLIRTVMALAVRYLVMAGTSYGVSAFHEPEPVHSPFDLWWLAALPAAVFVAWRLLTGIRARRNEVAYWVWALVSFAPVSQVFPFLYPMADRYLYFIMPGLIGVALLMGRDVFSQLVDEGSAEKVRRALMGAGAGMLVFFAWHSGERAAIWRNPVFILDDAASHYPNGVSAHLQRAQRSAQLGDVDTAVENIRGAVARGYLRFQQLDADPALAPIRKHAKFRAVVSEIAARRIAMFHVKENPTQLELRTVARAYVARGEMSEAIAVLERALGVGGPTDEATREEIAELRKYQHHF